MAARDNVVIGSVHVDNRCACRKLGGQARASAPARVDRAYWKGPQDCWKASPPAAPPSNGTRPPSIKATIRPTRNPSNTLARTFASANRCAAHPNNSVHASSSNMTRMCSEVRPEGPAAAPRLAPRKSQRDLLKKKKVCICLRAGDSTASRRSGTC